MSNEENTCNSYNLNVFNKFESLLLIQNPLEFITEKT